METSAVLGLLMCYIAGICGLSSVHDACSDSQDTAQEFEIKGSNWGAISGVCSCSFRILEQYINTHSDHPNLGFPVNATMHDDGCEFWVSQTDIHADGVDNACSACIDLSSYAFTEANNYTIYIERPSTYSAVNNHTNWFRIAVAAPWNDFELIATCSLIENKEPNPPCTPMLTDGTGTKHNTNETGKNTPLATTEMDVCSNVASVLGWVLFALLFIIICCVIIYKSVRTGRCLCMNQDQEPASSDIQTSTNESNGRPCRRSIPQPLPTTPSTTDGYQELQFNSGNAEQTYETLIEQQGDPDDTSGNVSRDPEIGLPNLKHTEYQECALGPRHSGDKLPLYHDNVAYKKC